MRNDMYIRIVLTVIAAALVYLCVVLTPIPVVSAQTGRIVGTQRPGEYTGPAEVVIVGWRAGEGGTMPVTIPGGVRVTNEVVVTGEVLVKQFPEDHLRTIVIGHEEGATARANGTFRPLNPRTGGLPVVVVPGGNKN
jgi:hypothetical protein